jgi:hypothetical protein
LIDLQDNLIDSFASLLFVVIAFECWVQSDNISLAIDLKIVKNYDHSNSYIWFFFIKKKHEISLYESQRIAKRCCKLFFSSYYLFGVYFTNDTHYTNYIRIIFFEKFVDSDQFLLSDFEFIYSLRYYLWISIKSNLELFLFEGSLNLSSSK